jgi:hypothetical protein
MDSQAPDALSVVRLTLALLVLYWIVTHIKLIVIGLALIVGLFLLAVALTCLKEYRDTKPLDSEANTLASTWDDDFAPLYTTGRARYRRRKRSY